MNTLHIKVFHDTVCPWCRIGKKNLLTALEELGTPSIDVDISYYTFFLHRDLPEEGVDYEKYLTSKFRGYSLKTINEPLIKLGKQAGITYNFELIKRIPNTILSNTLIYLTPPEKKLRMVDRLGELYFEQGANIGDINILIDLVHELELSITPEQLQDPKNRNVVIEQDNYGKDLGITGVPFFVFEDKFAVSGAQPVSAFKNVIQRVLGDEEVLL